MTSLIVATILAIGSLTSQPAAGEKPCREHPKLIDRCFTVRGRMNFYDGAPSVRIWRVGTKRILGVSGSRFAVKGYTNLPQDIQDKLSWDTDLFGDFVVCPFTREVPHEMQLVCVDSATKLEVKKWEERRNH